MVTTYTFPMLWGNVAYIVKREVGDILSASFVSGAIVFPFVQLEAQQRASVSSDVGLLRR